MSKAFTKDDDQAGFAPPPPSRPAAPPGAFRVTTAGARRIRTAGDPRHAEALARAEVLPPQPFEPERAALGVTVNVRRDGVERAYRLVSSEERALLGEGCSAESPLGRALLGARKGDKVEIETPRGTEELVVTRLEGDGDD